MTDIRKGDLVKGVRKDDPEETFTGRVRRGDSTWFETDRNYFETADWDVEVLDRPLPPVEPELLEKAVKAYRGTQSVTYEPAITAVINAVREFDRKKESSK